MEGNFINLSKNLYLLNAMEDSSHPYIFWQGWKLPDLMFATRRSLSEARTAIAKQLENVYSSIGVMLYILLACMLFDVYGCYKIDYDFVTCFDM